MSLSRYVSRGILCNSQCALFGRDALKLGDGPAIYWSARGDDPACVSVQGNTKNGSHQNLNNFRNFIWINTKHKAHWIEPM